jgi:regulator of protease activity HflC (stomatin/prohibitin superfamily)
MIALFVIGLLALVAGGVSYLTRNKGYSGKPVAIGITLVGAVLVVLSLVLSSFVTVPAGNVGVVVRFSGVTGRTLQQGLQTKVPFIDSVVRMSIKTQIYGATATAASQDLQDVKASIALNYHLNESSAVDVFQTLGLDYIETIASPAIQETVKEITAKFPAEDLILRRDTLKGAITDSLTNRLQGRGIVVETISITNFEFSQVFTAAIEAKVAALQAVLEAQNKLERVKVEAQQAEAQAKGLASARVAQANGEAEFIRIVTEAQIKANKAISDTLTPEVLQYILLDRFGKNVQLFVVPGSQGLDLVLPGVKP